MFHILLVLSMNYEQNVFRNIFVLIFSKYIAFFISFHLFHQEAEFEGIPRGFKKFASSWVSNLVWVQLTFTIQIWSLSFSLSKVRVKQLQEWLSSSNIRYFSIPFAVLTHWLLWWKLYLHKSWYYYPGLFSVCAFKFTKYP